MRNAELARKTKGGHVCHIFPVLVELIFQESQQIVRKLCS